MKNNIYLFIISILFLNNTMQCTSNSTTGHGNAKFYPIKQQPLLQTPPIKATPEEVFRVMQLLKKLKNQ